MCELFQSLLPTSVTPMQLSRLMSRGVPQEVRDMFLAVRGPELFEDQGRRSQLALLNALRGYAEQTSTADVSKLASLPAEAKDLESLNSAYLAMRLTNADFRAFNRLCVDPLVYCTLLFWRLFLHRTVFSKDASMQHVQLIAKKLVATIAAHKRATVMVDGFSKKILDDICGTFLLLCEKPRSRLFDAKTLLRGRSVAAMPPSSSLSDAMKLSEDTGSVAFLWYFIHRQSYDWHTHYYVSWQQWGTSAAINHLITQQSNGTMRRPVIAHLGYNQWVVQCHIHGIAWAANSFTALAIWLAWVCRSEEFAGTDNFKRSYRSYVSE